MSPDEKEILADIMWFLSSLIAVIVMLGMLGWRRSRKRTEEEEDRQALDEAVNRYNQGKGRT